MTAIQLFFLLVAAITTGSALMVVLSRRVMHAAFWLILALLGVAVVFVLLGSGFFAMAQVLIYIGAIAILIIFAVMLTRQMMDVHTIRYSQGWWAAAAASAGMFAVLLVALAGWQGFMQPAPLTVESGEDLVAIGKAMVDPNGFLLPFEMASVLLLAALIGAIYTAREPKGERE